MFGRLQPLRAHHLGPLAIVALAGVTVWGAVVASTAANTVPETKFGYAQFAIGPNDLKLEACGALTLTTLIAAERDATGTNGNDLILGGPRNQTLKGGKGDDCIAGGAGRDVLDGGQGFDVCIGSALASFTRCEVEIVAP